MLQPRIQEKQKCLYYAKGYWTEKTILDFWDDAVAQHGDREYITDSRMGRFTYRQIDDMASRLASFLQSSGIGPGEIVACQIPVWFEFAVLAYACFKIGAVIHPLSVTYEARDIAYFLDLHQPSCFVCPTWFHKRDYEAQILSLLSGRPYLRQVVLLDREKPKTTHFPTMEEIWREYQPAAQRYTGHADEVAAVLCTSGSTGAAKGAMLTHNNILFAEKQFNKELNLCADDVMFMPSPLNHATGFQHGILATMLLGARVVLQQKFLVSEAVPLMNREACTYSMGATTFIYDILRELEATGQELPHLKFYLCGGAPVPGSMIQKAWKHGIRVCEVYGSTESTPHVFVPPADALRLNGTVSGRPVEGVEIRVVDASGHDVPEGGEGEEWSRGPNVFVGYTSGMQSATCVLDDEGWFHSGDLCRKDKEGFIRITGRMKDVIIRGGENLHAVQLEENLADCPQLAEYAIVGMPDARMGERICAYAVLKPGVASFALEDLLRHLQTKGVPKWQWPERLEILDALPRTDSGKIQKFLLREWISRQVTMETKEDMPQKRMEDRFA